MSKRRKLEPIQLEDLVNSPFSQGLESVLRFQPPQIKDTATQTTTGAATIPEPGCGDANSVPPNLQAPYKEPPVIGAPVIGAPETEAVQITPPVLSEPSPACPPPVSNVDIIAPTIHKPAASSLDAPNSGASELGALDPRSLAPQPIVQSNLVYRETAKPRPWSSVRDAHTHAEQNLYQTLFNRGKPVAANARGLVIGVRTLARLVPMAYSNCHANLKSLVQKLAIEERPAERYNDGRLFLIYTEEEILRRRRAAGLTHVLKRTRGVSLVNPEAPDPRAPEHNSEASYSGAFELP